MLKRFDKLVVITLQLLNPIRANSMYISKIYVIRSMSVL